MADWITTPLLTAALTSLVAVAGWYVAHSNARRLDEVRRLEKEIDVQTALIAEIRINLLRFADIDLNKHERHVLKLIGSSQRPARYRPFVPHFPHAIVFEAVVKELHILPTKVIRDVVDYYKIEYSMRSFADGFQSESFGKLPAHRQRDVFADYIQTIRDSLSTGQAAIQSLERRIEESRSSRKGGVLRRLCGS